jgi:hypothetical protein
MGAAVAGTSSKPRIRRPKPFAASAEALRTAYNRLSRNREFRV